MNKLITDPVLRPIAQLGVLGFVLLLGAIGVAFIALLYLRSIGEITHDNEFSGMFFKALRLPFENILAPFVAAFATALPVIFLAVCRKVDTTNAPPEPTSDLTVFGYLIVLLMICGLLIGGAAILSSHYYATGFSYLAGPEHMGTVRGTLTALISLQAIYLAQLLGITP